MSSMSVYLDVEGRGYRSHVVAEDILSLKH